MLDLESDYGRIRALSLPEKTELCQNAFCLLMEELTLSGVDVAEAVGFIESLIACASSRDAKAQEEERALYSGIVQEEVDLERFQALVYRGAHPDAVRSLDRLIDGVLGDEGKHAAVALAYCFLSADGNLTPSEVELFRKLLA